MNNVQILEKTGDFFSFSLSLFRSCYRSPLSVCGGVGNMFYWIWGNFVHQKMSPCLRVLQSTVDRSQDNRQRLNLSSRRSKYYDTEDGKYYDTKDGKYYDTKDGKYYDTKDGKYYDTKDGKYYDTKDGVSNLYLALHTFDTREVNNINNINSTNSSNDCGCYY